MLNDNVTDALGYVLRNQDNADVLPIDQLAKLMLDHAISSILIDNQKVLKALCVTFTDASKQKTGHGGSISDD